MLKLKNLSFSYRTTPVLENISTEIKQGEFLGIIGPNGSGKSTLLKLIVRILTPSKGNVFLDTKNIKDIPYSTYSQKVSYLPSNLETHFPYTVEEFISTGRAPFINRYGILNAEDLQIIEETMVLFELKGYNNLNITELSDGEKQKVFLAQAVVQQPALLILDEPTSHLDIGHSYKIMDIIKELNNKGTTIISVLHNLNLASEYCSTLTLMNIGKIVSSGGPSDVLTYQNIEETYKTKVLVYKNPHSGKPYVFGLPAHQLKNSKT
jgi:iron complex transport system ATP-binding protein